MRLPRLVLILLAYLPFAAQSVLAAEADVAKQAQALLERSAAADGPGAVMLIARGDTVVYRGGKGLAQIELGAPMKSDQVFRVASVTKMLTAATVLKLRDAGKLSLDDTLATYLPNFPGASGITLRQLLNHTSGVSDRVTAPIPGFSRRDLDTATVVGEIAKRAPDFPPGARFSYSNAGFILLGAVIEKVAGKPWHEAVREQVVAPLRLTHTVYGDFGPLIPGRVAGYSHDGATWAVRNAGYISSSGPAAAGGFLSTADDLSQWMRALATGKLLKPASVQEMFTAGPEVPGTTPQARYGLGVYLWSVRGEPMIGHTGQIPGFASVVGYLPRQDVTVVGLFNDDEANARDQGRRLAAIALGKPYDEPVATRPSAAALAALAGRYQDGEEVRTLLVQDGQLFAQRGTRKPIPMQVTAAGELHFVPDELSYFAQVHDAAGRVVRLDYFSGGDGPARPMPRLPDAP